MSMSIRRGSKTIEVDFIEEGGVLAQLEPAYPLDSTITGVVIRPTKICEYHDTFHSYNTDIECVCKFYCQKHTPPMQTDTYMQVLTNEQAREQQASCEVCKTAMFFHWDDNNILEDLTEKLTADGDYSEYEIYSSEIRPNMGYDCIRYCRLVPGSVELQYLSEDFDFLDAAKDRHYYWPDALAVSMETIQGEIKRRELLPRLCTCIEGRPCMQPYKLTCWNCKRPTCSDHARDYTYKLYEEHTVKICDHCCTFFEDEKR